MSGGPVNSICWHSRSRVFLGHTRLRRQRFVLCYQQGRRCAIRVRAYQQLQRPSKPSTVDTEGQLVRENESGQQMRGEVELRYAVENSVVQKRTLQEVLMKNQLLTQNGNSHTSAPPSFENGEVQNKNPWETRRFEQKLQGLYSPPKSQQKNTKFETGTTLTRMTAQALNNMRKNEKKKQAAIQKDNKQQKKAQPIVKLSQNIILEAHLNTYKNSVENEKIQNSNQNGAVIQKDSPQNNIKNQNTVAQTDLKQNGAQNFKNGVQKTQNQEKIQNQVPQNTQKSLTIKTALDQVNNFWENSASQEEVMWILDNQNESYPKTKNSKLNKQNKKQSEGTPQTEQIQEQQQSAIQSQKQKKFQKNQVKGKNKTTSSNTTPNTQSQKTQESQPQQIVNNLPNQELKNSEQIEKKIEPNGRSQNLNSKNFKFDFSEKQTAQSQNLQNQLSEKISVQNQNQNFVNKTENLKNIQSTTKSVQSSAQVATENQQTQIKQNISNEKQNSQISETSFKNGKNNNKKSIQKSKNFDLQPLLNSGNKNSNDFRQQPNVQNSTNDSNNQPNASIQTSQEATRNPTSFQTSQNLDDQKKSVVKNNALIQSVKQEVTRKLPSDQQQHASVQAKEQEAFGNLPSIQHATIQTPLKEAAGNLAIDQHATIQVPMVEASGNLAPTKNTAEGKIFEDVKTGKNFENSQILGKPSFVTSVSAYIDSQVPKIWQNLLEISEQDDRIEWDEQSSAPDVWKTLLQVHDTVPKPVQNVPSFWQQLLQNSPGTVSTEQSTKFGTNSGTKLNEIQVDQTCIEKNQLKNNLSEENQLSPQKNLEEKNQINFQNTTSQLMGKQMGKNNIANNLSSSDVKSKNSQQKLGNSDNNSDFSSKNLQQVQKNQQKENNLGQSVNNSDFLSKNIQEKSKESQSQTGKTSSVNDIDKNSNNSKEVQNSQNQPPNIFEGLKKQVQKFKQEILRQDHVQNTQQNLPTEISNSKEAIQVSSQQVPKDIQENQKQSTDSKKQDLQNPSQNLKKDLPQNQQNSSQQSQKSLSEKQQNAAQNLKKSLDANSLMPQTRNRKDQILFQKQTVNQKDLKNLFTPQVPQQTQNQKKITKNSLQHFLKNNHDKKQQQNQQKQQNFSNDQNSIQKVSTVKSDVQAEEKKSDGKTQLENQPNKQNFRVKTNDKNFQKFSNGKNPQKYDKNQKVSGVNTKKDFEKQSNIEKYQNPKNLSDVKRDPRLNQVLDKINSEVTKNMIAASQLPFQKSDAVIGKVVKINSGSVLVQIKDCPEIFGLVLTRKFSPIVLTLKNNVENNIWQNLFPIGLVRQFKVLKIPDQIQMSDEGKLPLLSSHQLDLQLMKKRAGGIVDVALKHQQMIDMQVTKMVKNGIMGLVAGMEAFISLKQIPPPSTYDEKILRENDFWNQNKLQKVFGGEDCCVKVVPLGHQVKKIQVQNTHSGYIEQVEINCSITKAYEFKAQEELQVGAIVDGVVSKVDRSRAYIYMSGYSKDGLIKLPNISARAVKNARDVFKEGDNIRVCVVGIEKGGDTLRFFLSTRVLEKEKGDMLVRKQWVYDNAHVNVQPYLKKIQAQMGQEKQG